MTIEEKGKPVSDADRQMLNARVEQAGELFGSGYNCSQSVVAAFADLYGVERELALRMSAPFGGGIGRMRETCGAACGLFMLAGLENGSTEAGAQAAPNDLQAVIEQQKQVIHSLLNTDGKWSDMEKVVHFPPHHA